MHIEAQSLTILNVTQTAVKANRNSLNNVVTTLGQFDVGLRNFSDNVNARLIETNNFILTYLHLDLLLSEMRSLIHRASILFEHLDSLEIGIKVQTRSKC